jgi:rhomboid protease GluP
MVGEMHDAAQNQSEAEWPAVGCWPSLAAAYDHALVVLAMNLDCQVDDGEDGCYAVRADPAHAAAIRHEFAVFAAEESQKRERVDPPVFPAGVELAALWVAALVVVFLKQVADPQLSSRFSNSSEALIAGGEWWRPFTALFFHADFGHLMGNVFIGGMFCLLVAQSIGAWRAWLLILAGGTLGNALNAWAHFPEAFQSIGASTATFAAVGILVGGETLRAWRARSYQLIKPLMIPLFVGIIVLGWFGTGGETTDVAGHVAGFGSGILLGLLAGARQGRSAA